MVIILVYYSFIVSDLEVIPINPEKPKPPPKNVVVVYDNTLVPPTIRLCPLLISVVCLFCCKNLGANAMAHPFWVTYWPTHRSTWGCPKRHFIQSLFVFYLLIWWEGLIGTGFSVVEKVSNPLFLSLFTCLEKKIMVDWFFLFFFNLWAARHRRQY